MNNFEYVSKAKRSEVKKELIKLINLVQDEVRKDFTFSYEFIGSDKRNMVTYEPNSNVGYDFDVNLRVNKNCLEFETQQIKNILMNAFDKYVHLFKYDYCEDSKRVITIKVKDRKNSRILHSCDFAIVYNCSDGRQFYLHFNKKQNSYSREAQPLSFYQLSDNEERLKKGGYWQEVRDLYLHKKNINQDKRKKSRSIYAETINEVYSKRKFD